MSAKTIRYKALKEELLEEPATRAAYNELETAYQIARLRIIRGLTQEELAERVQTKQPSIARLESGKLSSLPFLERVVAALEADMEIHIKPRPDAPVKTDPPQYSPGKRFGTAPAC